MAATPPITSRAIAWEDRPRQQKVTQVFSKKNLAEIFAKNINRRYGEGVAKVVESRTADGWRVLVWANKFDPSMETLQFPHIRTAQTIDELRTLPGRFPFSVPKITYVEIYEEEREYNDMKETLLRLDELDGLKVAFDDAGRQIAYCEGQTTLEHLSLFEHHHFDLFYQMSNTSKVERSAFEEDIGNLLRDATDFFQSAQVHPIEPKAYTAGQDAQLIAGLLERDQGFCMGEIHWEDSGRRFLIENMQSLRAQGVTTLFMEFLHYDTMQELLDAYFNSSDESISGYLATHLEEFDGVRKQRTKCNPAYGCAKLIECAKKAGIRVVGIDTALSTECGKTSWGATGSERLLAMNFVAQQIIRQEMGTEKFVALMGRDHVRRGTDSDPVPTVPEILNIPGIYMEQSGR